MPLAQTYVSFQLLVWWLHLDARFGELNFPEDLAVGLAVRRLRARSITYSLGLFRHVNDEVPESAATCRFVHVYVDPQTRLPVAIPDTQNFDI